MASDRLNSVRSQLVGAWELVDHFAYLVHDELNQKYPLGTDPKAVIMYTPDGYMSAQFVLSGPLSAGTSHGVETDAPQPSVGGNYMAYTGPFYLDWSADQKRLIVIHHAVVTNLPSLAGQAQRRIMRIVDESDVKYLTLELEEPMDVCGEDRIVRVKWRKLPEN